MGRSGVGAFHIHGSKATITIPTQMWKFDDRFPFKDKQKLEIDLLFPLMDVDGKKVEDMTKGFAIIVRDPSVKMDEEIKRNIQKRLE